MDADRQRRLERARKTQCCDPVIDGLIGGAIELLSPSPTDINHGSAAVFHRSKDPVLSEPPQTASGNIIHSNILVSFLFIPD
jgi:hypothetical protein